MYYKKFEVNFSTRTRKIANQTKVSNIYSVLIGCSLSTSTQTFMTVSLEL